MENNERLIGLLDHFINQGWPIYTQDGDKELIDKLDFLYINKKGERDLVTLAGEVPDKYKVIFYKNESKWWCDSYYELFDNVKELVR